MPENPADRHAPSQVARPLELDSSSHIFQRASNAGWGFAFSGASPERPLACTCLDKCSSRGLRCPASDNASTCPTPLSCYPRTVHSSFVLPSHHMGIMRYPPTMLRTINSSDAARPALSNGTNLLPNRTGNGGGNASDMNAWRWRNASSSISGVQAWRWRSASSSVFDASAWIWHPEMKSQPRRSEMQPHVQSQMQPQMQPQIQSQIQSQMQPQMQPQMQSQKQPVGPTEALQPDQPQPQAEPPLQSLSYLIHTYQGAPQQLVTNASNSKWGLYFDKRRSHNLARGVRCLCDVHARAWTNKTRVSTITGLADGFQECMQGQLLNATPAPWCVC